MTLDVCWSISATWYAGRLAVGWQPPPIERYEGLLAAHGLTDPFWQLRPLARS